MLPRGLNEDELISKLKASMRNTNTLIYGIGISSLREDDNNLDFISASMYLLHDDKLERYQYESILPFGIEYKKQLLANIALDILRRKILGLDCLNEILGKKLIKT